MAASGVPLEPSVVDFGEFLVVIGKILVKFWWSVVIFCELLVVSGKIL